MRNKIVIVGAGYGGLATAAILASQGRDVTVIEKNEGPGGRGRAWRKDGFLFDMGPSWYLMPEVFDRFFEELGAKREEYWDLLKLPTYYQVFFGDGSKVKITDKLEETKQVFESLEPGGARKLEAYLKAAEYKYRTALDEFLYRDYGSIFDFFNRKLVVEGLKLDVFTSLDRFIRKEFQDVRARQLLEYSMVFLGSSPSNAPALYSLMSHVDLDLGVYFPRGGMIAIAEGLERLAKERGAKIVYDTAVTKIVVKDGKVTGVRTTGPGASAAGGVAAAGSGAKASRKKGAADVDFPADVVLSNADYAHTETSLLDEGERSYQPAYWEKATVAPSMLVAYMGTKEKIPGLEHHNLYFSSTWDRHFDTLFKDPAWPHDACFYTSVVSKTDPSVAPPGGENIFLLVPAAAGLADDDATREAVFNEAMDTLEKKIGTSIRDKLVVKRIFSQRDFAGDYNAFKGTALGLSHTLRQTAVFRPGRRSKKVEGLYYAGQYTHPGIGVPMVLIAARLASQAIAEDEK
jgi:phytoene desaturase